MRHHTENYVIVCVSMLSSLIKWQRYSTSHINEDLMGRFLNSLYEQSVSGLYQDIQAAEKNSDRTILHYS